MIIDGTPHIHVSILYHPRYDKLINFWLATHKNCQSNGRIGFHKSFMVHVVLARTLKATRAHCPAHIYSFIIYIYFCQHHRRMDEAQISYHRHLRCHRRAPNVYHTTINSNIKISLPKASGRSMIAERLRVGSYSMILRNTSSDRNIR